MLNNMLYHTEENLVDMNIFALVTGVLKWKEKALEKTRNTKWILTSHMFSHDNVKVK